MAKLECTVGSYLRSADSDDSGALQGALDSGVQYNTISMALRNFGVRISGQTLSRHARGLCSCEVLAQQSNSAASLSEALRNLGG